MKNSKNKETKKAMEKEPQMNRRSFLNRVWRWLGVIALLEFISLIFPFLRSGNKKEQNKVEDLHTIGKAEEIKAGTVVPYKSGRLYLVRLKNGGFLALSLKCTHLGCSVNWIPEKNEFICPCHSSIFDIKGNVVKSPAPRPLEIFRVVIEEGLVKVDLSKSIARKHFDPRQVVFG